MPAECAYDYAIVRIVPRVERGEMINVGIIVSCPDTEFIAARIELDEPRLLALDPGLDVATIRAHLSIIPAICEGRADAGPIAALPARQRFYWLVSPRSTVIQVSPVVCVVSLRVRSTSRSAPIRSRIFDGSRFPQFCRS